MAGVPFIEHGALVHGRAAVGVAWLLHRSIDRGGLDGLPEGVYEETVAAVRAVDLASMAWTRRTAAEFGRTAARRPVDPSPSTHASTITVDEAARMLKLSVRRTRDLAASGLGRKAGGTWLLDPAAVEAEARRRGAA
jgi:hypothetical protein